LNFSVPQRLTGLLLCTTFLLLSGCSLFSNKAKLTQLAQQGHWEGRLQLRILQDKPEQFSFNFDLQGSAENGELTIYSPLGSTVAVASWTPSGAVLTEGNIAKPFRIDGRFDPAVDRCCVAVAHPHELGSPGMDPH